MAPWLLVAVLEAVLLAVLAVLWVRERQRVRAMDAEVTELQERLERPLPWPIPGPREVVKGVWETASRVREHGLGGALRSSIEDLAGWAQVERPDLMRLAGPDGRLSIMFSDIEGSTALNESLGDRQWVRVLARHDKVVRAAVDRHEGHVIKSQGDGYLMVFSTPNRAVRAAVAVQRATRKGTGRVSLAVRIGIHHGGVVHRGNDIFGRNVALAARVAGLAEGGEILISEPVGETMAASGKLDDLELTAARRVSLKGLSGEFMVRSVEWRSPHGTRTQGRRTTNL